MIATDIFNGQDKSFNEIKQLLDNTQEDTDEHEAVTEDIPELIDSLDIHFMITENHKVYINVSNMYRLIYF